MAISNPGNLLNSTPGPIQQATASNYLDFTGGANDWAQQYLPDLMEKEAEVFGPRTISGFLSQVGAEEAMTSDQVVWSEQGRLHLSYTCTITDVDDGAATNGGEITITDHIDTNATYNDDHGVRVNDTIIVATTAAVLKCLVVKVVGNVLDVEPYGAANITSLGEGNSGTLLVYGSEFAKGKSYNSQVAVADDRREANEPTFKSYTNKPIILKDYYEVSGSDASRIGWVEKLKLIQELDLLTT